MDPASELRATSAPTPSFINPNSGATDNSWDLPEGRILQQVSSLLENASTDVENLFNPRNAEKKPNSANILPLGLQLSNPAVYGDVLNVAVRNNLSTLDDQSKEAFESMRDTFVEKEAIARTAFLLFKDRISPDVWNCCSRLCFASIAVDATKSNVMQELLLIHRYAERCHAEMENIGERLEKRRRGIGTSHLVFSSKSRGERERDFGSHGRDMTRREEYLASFASFVMEVLPYLYGNSPSPRMTPPPPHKICTQAICCLLGISRNFLYHRKRSDRQAGRMVGSVPDDIDLTNLVDSSGLRLRQHRRVGLRVNVPQVQDLPQYDCGCDTPCFAETPVWVLASEEEEFSSLSKELRARHKENCYLLNKLYIPFSNCTTKVCNSALAALYNVSTTLIGDVRAALDAMCIRKESVNVTDSSEEVDSNTLSASLRRKRLLNDGLSRYKYKRGHPMNRLPDAVRDSVERHLDMVMRADPAGSDGTNVCRVYSPEINTFQKLRDTIREALDLEEGPHSELSSSTIQRMIVVYLKKRNYGKINFTQSDHNACPNCKSMQYAILQYDYELKSAKSSIAPLEVLPRPMTEALQAQFNLHSNVIGTRTVQLEQCISEMRRHNSRDMHIRGFLKNLADAFRDVEREYWELKPSVREAKGWGWNSYLDRAVITHQDDMSKVDLPHFVVEASSDITRWRFDINAHVNAVTNDAIVFSHEQGCGAKNASLIMEEILLDLLEHLLTCRGESIKVVVSDNAAVGKNWMTTIALPQYIVDQGLAEVCIMVFLENNHGKWLADMLFGQFQTRRRRSTILGVDDMLHGFEQIRRRNGKVRGFVLNPLSSINFAEILKSLGYETAPPQSFGFQRRNIHFAAACSPGAKRHLPVDLQDKLSVLLPDDAGMVRVSSEPPSNKAQCELPYEDRYFDVPAARTSISGGQISVVRRRPPTEVFDPLVVPVDTPYSAMGKGVVSTRNAVKVGYNGIEFRSVEGCAELRRSLSRLSRTAWPKGLIDQSVNRVSSAESMVDLESRKCAPVNWIAREPVHHFCRDATDWKARYPPRNLLNA